MSALQDELELCQHVMRDQESSLEGLKDQFGAASKGFKVELRAAEEKFKHETELCTKLQKVIVMVLQKETHDKST